MSAPSRCGTPGLLDAVVGAARAIVSSRRRRVPAERLVEQAMGRAPRGDLFRERLSRRESVNVIAECKRRSPSKGVLVPHYDPAALARLYEEGGAAAVSVLTEPTFFDGSIDHLEAVRGSVSLPLLRKDFIVDPYQLYEARAFGADAVLLIVAALEGEILGRLLRQAESIGLAVLVEVHDRLELDLALDAGARMIGVNSRNLRTLAVDTRVCENLAASMPTTVVAVAESGLASEAAVRQMHAAGYAAVLVGEWLATHPDPVRALRDIRGTSGLSPEPGGHS
jgi:indole-3-glycerol phosphate synthase